MSDLVIANQTMPTATAVDGDWVSKESRIQILEMAAQECRNRWVHSTIELGHVLREHRDLCIDRQERTVDLLERLGLTATTGYRLIRTAEVVRQLPSLKDLADKQYSHAVALIEGASESQLEEIAAGDNPNLPLDEISRMSVRQLRQRLRKLSDQTAKVVAEETRTLRSERDALQEDLDAARAALASDVKTARRTARKLQDQALAMADLGDTLADQILALDEAAAHRLRGELETAISAASMRLKSLWETWQQRALEMGLDD